MHTTPRGTAVCHYGTQLFALFVQVCIDRAPRALAPAFPCVTEARSFARSKTHRQIVQRLPALAPEAIRIYSVWAL
eukprot:11181192-Lingulodinium_polyedra.AAC.1